MRLLQIILLLLLSLPFSASSSIHSNHTDQSYKDSLDSINETEYFIFYNNFWLNLHFYMYETALQSKETPLENIVEKEIWNTLNVNEKAVYKKVISYYLNNEVFENHFNQELMQFRSWIIDFTELEILPGSYNNIQFIEVLNEFKSVYFKHFWEAHRKINMQKLQMNIELIKSTEKSVINQISGLAQVKWQNNKIRVDLSTKSPGGGAFTLARVPSSIVLGTVLNYPEIRGDWVETLFHEAAHTVIKATRGPIAESIKRVCEKFGVTSPKNLWHSILFYMAGVISQKAFSELGITNYEIYMIREKVFTRHQPSIFKYFSNYIEGSKELDEVMEQIILELTSTKD